MLEEYTYQVSSARKDTQIPKVRVMLIKLFS